MPLVVISEPPAGNPFKEFVWREWNIPRHGTLRPIYEWTFNPGFGVVPGSWKVTLPTDIYLATVRADARDLDTKDLPRKCAWYVHTGYAYESETIVTSIQDAKRQLEACFRAEYEDWEEWRRMMNAFARKHLPSWHPQ